MITKIDPSDYSGASTVQIDSDLGNVWRAVDEIEDWAAGHGFVRTGEYYLRPVLVGGQRRFRGICYRITEEERLAADEAQRRMIERGDALMASSLHRGRDGRGGGS